MADGSKQPHLFEPINKEDRQRHVLHLHRMEIQVSPAETRFKVISVGEVAIYRLSEQGHEH